MFTFFSGDPAYCDRITDGADDYNFIFHRCSNCCAILSIHSSIWLTISVAHSPKCTKGTRRGKHRKYRNRKSSRDFSFFQFFRIFMVVVWWACLFCDVLLSLLSFFVRASEPFVLSIKWHILNSVWFTPGQRNKSPSFRLHCSRAISRSV